MSGLMNTLMPVFVTARVSQRCWRAGLALLAAFVAWVPPAAAQLSSIGVNPALIGFPVRGSDTAHDPIHNVYLVVGAHGTVQGVFVNSAGSPVTAPFQISDGSSFAQFPRALYSPHINNGAGGFLVTWHQGEGLNLVNTRIVAYPNQVLSQQWVIPSGATWWESGPAIAYSSTSQLFLVTWRASNYVVTGARVALNGQPIGAAFAISDPAVGARDPNVAWNPYTNEFGVVYTGFDPSRATTAFARVSAGGVVLRRNVFNSAPATYITDLSFNTATGRFLAAWSQSGTLGAEIDGNGDVISQGLLSSATGTYDGLGVAYNPASGTFLLVGHGSNFDVWAAELNSRGARTSGDVTVTSAGGPVGSFYPRATANANSPQWNISFAHNFNLLRGQVVATSSSGGGPGGTLGAPAGGGTAPPPPPPPPPTGCTTPDPFTAIGGGTCVNGGWVPGTSGSGGTTGGCTTPSPGTGWTCVNGGWLPPTSGGTSGGCTTPAPGAGWTCVNGGWLPPSGGSTGGCTTPPPGAGWTCVNGGWLPPTSSGGSSSGGCTTPDPFAAMGGGTCVNGGWIPGGSGAGGSSGGCTTPPPGAGWTCVNGGWRPPSGGTTGGCTTPSPGAGWTCVNGGWLPPTSGGGSGGCTTPDPFAAMGGGSCVNGGWTPGGFGGGCTTPPPGAGWTCVNGGWLPPTAGGSGGGGCTTPDPFVAMGGGTCVNGGWIPGGSSSCATPPPGAGWTCVNGGWLPPTMSSATAGGCTTPDPFAAMGGGTCVNGGWTFGSTGGGGGGGCTTPDPFTAIGGGLCINGGWIPNR